VVAVLSSTYAAFPLGTSVVGLDLITFAKKWQFTVPYTDSYFTVRPYTEDADSDVVCGIIDSTSPYIACFENGWELKWSVPFPDAGEHPTAFFISPSFLIATSEDYSGPGARYITVSIPSGDVVWSSTSFLSCPNQWSTLWAGYRTITLDSTNNRVFKQGAGGFAAFRIDAGSGTSALLWNRTLPVTFVAIDNIIYASDIVIYATLQLSGGYFFANNATTGDFIWKMALPPSYVSAGLAVHPELKVMVTVTENLNSPSTLIISYYKDIYSNPAPLWSTSVAGCPTIGTNYPTIDAKGAVYLCACGVVLGIDNNGTKIYSYTSACDGQVILAPDGTLISWAGNTVIRSGNFVPFSSTTTTTSTTAHHATTSSAENHPTPRGKIWFILGGVAALLLW